MSTKKRATVTHTVADFAAAMESLAPSALAQEWDNVGLLAGDMSAKVRRVILCIDLTPAVVAEAALARTDLILAYHPPIFKPISSLRVPSKGMDAVVFECIKRGMAIYSPHTALDAAEGGTNDVLAALCGVKDTEPIEYADAPGESQMKVVVFVPPQEAETAADAMFAAGAGQIGDYSKCSYRTAGKGSFLGGDATNPAIGKRGRLEYVDELRLEVIVPSTAIPAVVKAIYESHSYEEPAFDIYPLKSKPVRGMGRWGDLPRPPSLGALARKLKRATGAVNVQTVGGQGTIVKRAIVSVGAAGSTPFRTPLGAQDVIVTGEIRHHDALTIKRVGCSAIALGHWASERPVLTSLADRLQTAMPGIAARVSESDCDPFA